ncbi:DUF6612 family protein [Staphylospora marina]|uniref:DUF6612 family protein n=1 Tax=Staphylospora marina TaxID=2490858 RepID=UPI000F5BAFB9|nr:DUF6612 family protein [Staphylospora marina]
MKNFWRLSLGLLASVALILAGCSQEAAKPGEQSGVEEKKEPTPLEVLLKADEVTNKGSFVYDANITQKMNAGGQNIDLGMSFTMEMVGEPFAMHMKGDMNMMGQSMPMEMYQVGQDMYMNVAGLGWMKSQDTSSPAGQQPNEIADVLVKFINALGGDKLPDGIKVTKQGNDWLVETDYAVLLKNKAFASDIQQMIKDSLDDETLKEFGVAMDSSKLNFTKYTGTMIVDGTTYQTKSYKSEMIVGIPTGKEELKMEQVMEMTLKGEYNGKIEVPEEVKKTAKPE